MMYTEATRLIGERQGERGMSRWSRVSTSSGILQQRSLEGVTVALLFIVILVAVESKALVGARCQPRPGTCGQ